MLLRLIDQLQVLISEAHLQVVLEKTQIALNTLIMKRYTRRWAT